MNWKIALLVSTVAAIGGTFAFLGCGGDDCTQADDHLAECVANATTSSSSSGSMMEVCDLTRDCQSQCINNHTCTQITGNDPGYTSCLAACQGK
jgi:hypothetical protein